MKAEILRDWIFLRARKVLCTWVLKKKLSMV